LSQDLTRRSQSTDKCYQCSTDVPFCHWQTYIAAGQPTLSWFSCISASMADDTLFASTITNNLLSAGPSGSASNGTSSSSSLSTGAIAGIAIAGAVAIIACVAIVTVACVRVRRKDKPAASAAAAGTEADPNSPTPQPGYAVSPLSPADAKLAHPNMSQQQYAYEMPAAEPQELPGGGIVAGPEGTAKLASYSGGEQVPVAEMPDTTAYDNTGYEGRWAEQQAWEQQQLQQQWDAQQQHEQLTPPPGQGQGYLPSPHFTPPPEQRYTPPLPAGQHGFTPPPQGHLQPAYGYGPPEGQHGRQYSR
jgi:hypothetical protein